MLNHPDGIKRIFSEHEHLCIKHVPIAEEERVHTDDLGTPRCIPNIGGEDALTEAVKVDEHLISKRLEQ